MSKVLKIVGFVAAIALAIPTGGSSLLAVGLGISGLAATGLVLALNVGASLLAKRPKSPATSENAKDRLQVSIDPRTPRKFVFGKTAMATDLRDQEIIGSDQSYVDRFIVVASHAVQSIEEIWFDNKVAWTSGGGVTGDSAGYLTVTPILEGSSGNAINISGRMGSTRRYTGLAYAYLRSKLTGNTKKTTSPFQQSLPSRMTVVGKGAKVYDPRLDSTVTGGSGAQRADDQATWAWDDNASRNPALQMLWYLLGWRINGRLAVGKGIPPARLNLESFITAANACDESVALAVGGTEPRYRGDGVFSEGDATSTVLDQLKAAMNAELDDVDGRLRLLVLVNDLAAPIADFSEDDVLDEFNWDQTTSLDDTFNVVRGTYIDPSANSLYQGVDYPEVRIASPDGIDRIETVDLQLVQSPSQAQRLAKQRVARMLYSGMFTATFGHRAWKVQRADVIRLTFAPLGFTNKLFRVVDTAVQVDGQVPMTLREEHPDIYLWDKEEAPAVAAVAPTTYDPSKDPLYTYVVNNAGAGAFTMVPHGNTAALDYTPTSLTKIGSDAVWDAGGYSKESYSSGCTVSARFGDPTKNVMFGLNNDASADASYLSIDYAIYNDATRNGTEGVSVWIDGAQQQVLQAATASASDIWSVRHDPTTGLVSFSKNGASTGTPIATDVGRSPPFAFDSSLYNVGASLLDIVFVGSGSKGTDGNVPALATIYKRSATTPALPTTTGTFNPYTNTVSGLNNGWTTAVPAANGNPLWVSAAPSTIIPPATTDTIAAGEWASPVIDSQDGAAGANGYQAATVELKQRNNTGIAPSTPGSTLTFDFTTGVLSGTLGSWTQADPPAANGKFLFRTIAAALATAPATTDTIASGEWQAAQQIVKDGENAKLIGVSRDRSTVHLDGTGALSPSSQTTTFTVVKQNLSSSSVTVSLFQADGTQINANTYLTGSGSTSASGNDLVMTGTTATLTAANFQTARGTTEGIRVLVSHADGVSGDADVKKVQDGATGAPGAPGGATFPSQAVGGTLNPGPITVNYPVQVTIPNGGSQLFSGHVSTNSQLTTGGTITAQIQIAEAGSGSWAAVATSDNTGGEFDYFSDGTRASGDLSGTKTNTSGAAKVYDVRMQISKTGGTVTLTNSETFFKAG